MPPPIQPAPECRLRPPPRRPSRLVRRRARAPPAPFATDVYRLRGRVRSFVSPDALLASGAAPDVLPYDGPRSSQVLGPKHVLVGRIATDQALHFSILAVSFCGWRLDGTSPAWRATEAGVDHGAPGKSRTCKRVVGFFVVVWSVCFVGGAVLHVMGREIRA